MFIWKGYCMFLFSMCGRSLQHLRFVTVSKLSTTGASRLVVVVTEWPHIVTSCCRLFFYASMCREVLFLTQWLAQHICVVWEAVDAVIKLSRLTPAASTSWREMNVMIMHLAFNILKCHILKRQWFSIEMKVRSLQAVLKYISYFPPASHWSYNLGVT